jgi:hypothetical protein
MTGPNKGPVGMDHEGNDVDEPQEPYEEMGGHPDIKDGNFTQDPFSLKADEEDHTPNGKTVYKEGKIGWNFQHGRGNGGVGV